MHVIYFNEYALAFALDCNNIEKFIFLQFYFSFKSCLLEAGRLASNSEVAEDFSLLLYG